MGAFRRIINNRLPPQEVEFLYFLSEIFNHSALLGYWVSYFHVSYYSPNHDEHIRISRNFSPAHWGMYYTHKSASVDFTSAPLDHDLQFAEMLPHWNRRFEHVADNPVLAMPFRTRVLITALLNYKPSISPP